MTSKSGSLYFDLVMLPFLYSKKNDFRQAVFSHKIKLLLLYKFDLLPKELTKTGSID